jgi:subtilisin family serine protease
MSSLFLALLLILAGPSWAAPLPPSPSIPGEVLVGLRPQRPGEPRLPESYAAVSATVLGRLAALDVDRLRLPEGADAAAALARLSADPRVRYAEPHLRVRALALANPPGDTLYARAAQWYLGQVAADRAYDAWRRGAVACQTTITVAVLDTGLGSSLHQDLGGQVVPGYSFVYDSASTADLEGHGTFVSGLIAAKPDPSGGAGSGMLGVGFAFVKVMPVQVLDASGNGDVYDTAQGMVYAADRGARVLNLSEGLYLRSGALEDAVRYAYTRGCVLVAAAGNDDGPATYPAAFPQVVSVGALDRAGRKTWYSNFGRLDLSAPGGDGLSSCAGSFTDIAPGSDPCLQAGLNSEIVSTSLLSNRYITMFGTSFACPLVAGAAALLLAQDPSRNPGEVLRLLSQSADPTAEGEGFQPRAGWGRLNVYRALMGAVATRSVLPALKLYNWPNPFNPSRDALTHFSFALGQPGDATLRLYDMAGDLVWQRALTAGQTVAGLNSVDWDGRNGAGREAANGVYRLVLTCGQGRAVHYVAVLR